MSDEGIKVGPIRAPPQLWCRCPVRSGGQRPAWLRTCWLTALCCLLWQAILKAAPQLRQLSLRDACRLQDAVSALPEACPLLEVQHRPCKLPTYPPTMT